ncbi:MAG: hypothetical protein ACRCYU_23470 [Nocardioides sp.]
MSGWAGGSARLRKLAADALGVEFTEGRHRSLEPLSALLHAVLVGRDAAALSSADLPAGGGLWVAPTWEWVVPRANLGRKSRGRTLFPLRLDWSRSSVSFIRPGRRQRASFATAGLGHHRTSSVLLGADPDLCNAVVADDHVWVPVESPMAVERRIAELVEAGEAARWALRTYLEPHAWRALVRSHASIRDEIGRHTGESRDLLDETKLRGVLDEMVYGRSATAEESGHPGMIDPMIDLMLEPHAFVKVDPMKYLCAAVRRDAPTMIRREIGDPHVGPKVRRVAAELGAIRDIEELLKRYREEYPRDRLGAARAEAALRVLPDAMAGWSNAGRLRTGWLTV